MTDECPRCEGAVRRFVSRVHNGLVRERCTICSWSDYAWLTVAQIAKQAECGSGDVRQVIASMTIGPKDARGEGTSREFSPDVQTRVIAEIRRRARDGMGGLRR